MLLVKIIYSLTNDFPREEIYSLNAFSSGAELETQIEIAKQLPMTQKLNYNLADQLLEEVMKMLNKLISSMSSTQ